MTTEQQVSEQQVFDYYNNTFIKIYADLVAVLGDKPPEVLFELEASFAHIVVAKTTPDEKVKQGNLHKAHGHLVRASLDSAKLLWFHRRKKAESFIDDKQLRTFCTNASEDLVLKRYRDAEQAAKIARQTEVGNVGKSPDESVILWYEAVVKYEEFLDSFDPDKIKKFNQFSLYYQYKQQILSFFLGVIASTLVSWFWPTLPVSNSTKSSDEITSSTPLKK